MRSFVPIMQCGARTPGTVIAAVSPRERNPAPTGAWGGKILEAVVEACPPHTGRPMRWVSLLERIPAPTGEEICNSLAGNLCRCTGYIKIFEAVVEACRLTRGTA